MPAIPVPGQGAKQKGTGTKGGKDGLYGIKRRGEAKTLSDLIFKGLFTFRLGASEFLPRKEPNPETKSPLENQNPNPEA